MNVEQCNLEFVNAFTIDISPSYSESTGNLASRYCWLSRLGRTNGFGPGR